MRFNIQSNIIWCETCELFNRYNIGKCKIKMYKCKILFISSVWKVIWGNTKNQFIPKNMFHLAIVLKEKGVQYYFVCGTRSNINHKRALKLFTLLCCAGIIFGFISSNHILPEIMGVSICHTGILNIFHCIYFRNWRIY